MAADDVILGVDSCYLCTVYICI